MPPKISEMPIKEPPPELEGLSGPALECGLHMKKWLPNAYRGLMFEGKLRDFLLKQEELFQGEVFGAAREITMSDSKIPLASRPAAIEDAKRRAYPRYIFLPAEDEDPEMRGSE